MNENLHEAELLTNEDVRRIFHVSVRTLYRWRDEGRLTGYKVGRRVLYDPDEIKEILEDAGIRGPRGAKRPGRPNVR